MRIAVCTAVALCLFGAASASARDLPGRAARSPHQAPRVERRTAFLPAERDNARASTTESRGEAEPPFENIPGAKELGREEHEQLRNGRQEEEQRAERELDRLEGISIER
jgi:hypothetical protein